MNSDSGASQRSLFLRAISAAATVALYALAPAAHAQADRGGMPGDFDYYVLALSWSPTYCEGRGGDEDGGRGANENGYDDGRRYGGGSDYGRQRPDEQCSGTRPYAFVLHGLWPQYERKGWPEMCETGNKPWVTGETIDSMMDIMPSRRLVIQEYKKHGVCSGLDPRQYFSAARQAYTSIRIPNDFQDLSRPLTVSPEDVRKAFLDANRQLTADMIQVACSRNLLREVRICLTKELTPRPCSRGESSRRLCTYETVTMPPVRGGGTGPRGGPSYGSGERL
jgi:ribonuclease T2